MELPMHNMFPCSPCEQNAQAPERAPVTVARNRLFPKGEGNVHCEDWRTPFRNRKNMIIAPLQRIADVGGGLLPVAGFRCATGQIGASGAIPEAHLGNDRVDGLCYDTVLKGRLRKVNHIIHEHLTTEDIAQVEDILGKTGLAPSRRGKAERRSRGQVVHDFEQGRTLTSAGWGRST